MFYDHNVLWWQLDLPFQKLLKVWYQKNVTHFNKYLFIYFNPTTGRKMRKPKLSLKNKLFTSEIPEYIELSSVPWSITVSLTVRWKNVHTTCSPRGTASHSSYCKKKRIKGYQKIAPEGRKWSWKHFPWSNKSCALWIIQILKPFFPN